MCFMYGNALKITFPKKTKKRKNFKEKKKITKKRKYIKEKKVYKRKQESIKKRKNKRKGFSYIP